MPIGWKQEDKQKEGEQERVIEIKPEMIQSAMKPELDGIKSSLASVTEFILAQKKEKEDATAAARAAEGQRRRQESEDNKPDFILDPEGAMNHAMRPLMEQNAILAATIQKDKILGKMDFYSTDPEFQNKVDQLIDSQPLHLRSNAGIIMNAYKSVYFDSRKDIEEGKIKSLASVNSNGGKGADSGAGTDTGDKKNIVLSAEEKLYAKKLGISEADWAKQKGQLEYV